MADILNKRARPPGNAASYCLLRTFWLPYWRVCSQRRRDGQRGGSHLPRRYSIKYRIGVQLVNH